MINVEAIIEFNDLEEKKLRKVGDKFKVSEERFDFLSGNNPLHAVAVKKIEVVEEYKDEKKNTKVK